MGKFTLKKSLKRYTANVLNFLLLFSLIVPYGFFPKDVFAYTFPSTNELNKNTGVRPYVEAIETGVGYVKVAPTTPVLESPINNAYINDNTPLMQWEDSTVTEGTIKGYYYRIFHHCTDSSDSPESCSVFPNTTGLWRTTSEYQAGTTADGTYYWQVKSVDMNDNESEWSKLEKFTIDTVNPTKPVFTAPENNLYTNINFIKLKWTGGDDTGSGVKGYTLGYTFTPANGGTEKTWNTGLREIGNPYWHSGTYGHGEGKYVFWVKTVDKAGNEGPVSETLSVTYDKTAPLMPSGLYFWDIDNNKAVQCGGFSNTRHINEHWDTASDINFSHYEYSSFNAPNGSAGLIKSVFYTNYFNSSWWNIPTEGTYGFQVRTLDLAGNISPWAFNDIVGIDNSCKITIDWTAPVVKITSPLENVSLSGEVIIQGNVKDQNLSHYNISIYDGDADVNDFSKRLLQNTEYTTEFDTKNLLTWDTTEFDNGEYQIRLAARDLAGNRDDDTSIQVINVVVDNTSPTTESISDFSINEGSVIPTKEVLVEDNYELDEFCYSITSGIGDMPKTCINPVGSTDSWDVNLSDTILTELSNKYGITTSVANTSIIPEGDYSISYFAKDKAGNESTPHTFIVTIKNVVPTVLFSSSTTELLEGNSVSFNGSFTDPGLDDSDWTYTLSFGDGTEDVIGTLTTEGNIFSNYSHQYTNAGDYTASLKVCEDGGLICTTDAIDITVGEVQGATTGSSTTTTNSPTLAKKVTTFIADILGVGGEGDVLALEEDEETLEDDTEEVKGSQTCDNPSTISGYIYIDSNENGEKDEKERVFPEISIRIYTITEGMEETVKQIVSDENGYWETTLCSGDYYISVDDSKLPNNYVLEEDTLGVQVEEDKDSTLNFEVLDERNFLQKYWPWILLAVGILGSIGIVTLDTRRKKEYI